RGNPREVITMTQRRFPVRIRIAVPPGGLGQRYARMTALARRELWSRWRYGRPMQSRSNPRYWIIDAHLNHAVSRLDRYPAHHRATSAPPEASYRGNGSCQRPSEPVA